MYLQDSQADTVPRRVRESHKAYTERKKYFKFFLMSFFFLIWKVYVIITSKNPSKLQKWTDLKGEVHGNTRVRWLDAPLFTMGRKVKSPVQWGMPVIQSREAEAGKRWRLHAWWESTLQTELHPCPTESFKWCRLTKQQKIYCSIFNTSI